MSVKELKKTKLNDCFKITTRVYVAAVIFLLLTFVFFGWAFALSDTDNGEAKDFLQSRLEMQLKEKESVSLNVTMGPSLFAEYDSNIASDKYYFVWSGDILNVAYLDYGTYQEVAAKTSNEESMKIYGVTKTIPTDVLEIAIDVANDIAGEEYLTMDNYQDYISTMYIDAVNPLHDNSIQVVAGIIFALLSIAFFVIAIVRQRGTKKTIQERTDSEWQKILTELDDESTKYYKKINLYLTDNYIVDLSNGLRVVEYKDIVWMYQYQLKQYGMTTNKNIVVATKDGKKISIANMDNLMKRSKKAYAEIMDFIVNKNSSIALGYTKENKKEMKNLYGIK